ncbi:MAG: ATP synthase F1 subunit epsilon [Chitinophagales bacterium]
MNLEVLTPEKRLYSGEVTGVKLPGTAGSFEILNNHAPLISSLEKGEMRIKAASGDTTIAIEDGFVECLKNTIVVLVGGGEVKA